MDLHAVWPDGMDFVPTRELVRRVVARNPDYWGSGSSYAKELTDTPVHPPDGGHLDVFDGLPGSGAGRPVDQFGLVVAVDGLGSLFVSRCAVEVSDCKRVTSSHHAAADKTLCWCIRSST